MKEETPKLTIKTYNRLWQQNKRLRAREAALREIIIENRRLMKRALQMLGSTPKKYL